MNVVREIINDGNTNKKNSRRHVTFTTTKYATFNDQFYNPLKALGKVGDAEMAICT
jgi:hypothetical protein